MSLMPATEITPTTRYPCTELRCVDPDHPHVSHSCALQCMTLDATFSAFFTFEHSVSIVDAFCLLCDVPATPCSGHILPARGITTLPMPTMPRTTVKPRIFHQVSYAGLAGCRVMLRVLPPLLMLSSIHILPIYAAAHPRSGCQARAHACLFTYMCKAARALQIHGAGRLRGPTIMSSTSLLHFQACACAARYTILCVISPDTSTLAQFLSAVRRLTRYTPEAIGEASVTLLRGTTSMRHNSDRVGITELLHPDRDNASARFSDAERVLPGSEGTSSPDAANA
ncbi:hypothetical protein OBBRIDRAFT_164634 [Obba rivulosa]|uniref:Uncharacterized protein n=1 Tax=Obba rivulosa TaxID=1052685 RepID=A0A8E2J491_9APHY|nr:hypothetical protein OBBRIDRAFT_164634 [Obba rivulosa]